VSQKVQACVSTAIPKGMVVFLNGERVVAIHTAETPVSAPPVSCTSVHFSSENFPGGSADVARWVAETMPGPA
jgi:hypothetical protein